MLSVLLLSLCATSAFANSQILDGQYSCTMYLSQKSFDVNVTHRADSDGYSLGQVFTINTSNVGEGCTIPQFTGVYTLTLSGDLNSDSALLKEKASSIRAGSVLREMVYSPVDNNDYAPNVSIQSDGTFTIMFYPIGAHYERCQLDNSTLFMDVRNPKMLVNCRMTGTAE